MTNIDDGETSPEPRTPNNPAADDPPGAVDWDAEAPAFDDEPDHGLREPAVREAWAARLRDWLPGRACDVLDVGCGTGSLSLLATEQGHRVTGVDSSTAMVALARAKLAGRPAVFLVGDATIATFPAHPTPRYATTAAVSFAALNLFITQTSWVKPRP